MVQESWWISTSNSTSVKAEVVFVLGDECCKHPEEIFSPNSSKAQFPLPALVWHARWLSSFARWKHIQFNYCSLTHAQAQSVDSASCVCAGGQRALPNYYTLSLFSCVIRIVKTTGLFILDYFKSQLKSSSIE